MILLECDVILLFYCRYCVFLWLVSWDGVIWVFVGDVSFCMGCGVGCRCGINDLICVVVLFGVFICVRIFMFIVVRDK